MTKQELIQQLQKKCHLTSQESSKIVEIFFNEMIKAFVKGERVEIRGLCSFNIKDYKPYIGRNPKTGERVQISAKKLPFFKCGKDLKERVDYPVN